MTARAVAFGFALAGMAALAAQDERAVARDPAQDADARGAALVALQRRGALDVGTALAALGAADEAVGATAAAIVRHAWLELPPELLQGLDADAVAAHRFVRELAWAPRPAATVWTEARIAAAPGRSLEDRCLALAARGRPLARADVDLVLEAARDGGNSEGWRLAVALLPAARADGLASRLHALLLQEQVEVAQIVPLLDRMSHVGVQQMLGVVATLPAAVATALCDHVAQRDPAAVRERARTMLDGEAPLEVLWLRFAAPLLDDPARRERLLAVLADDAAPRALQRAAFAALLDAREAGPRVVAWVRAHADDADGADDLARLVDDAVDLLPGDLLAAWLEGEPELARRVVRALPRRSVLGAEVERALLHVLDGAVADGVFLYPATSAILQCGSESAVRALWPQLRRSPQWGAYVDTLARRRAPFAHELLLLELEAEPEGVDAAVRERQLDDVRLGLVALDDRRQLAQLVDHAVSAEPTFVRRCAHHARPLPCELAARLLARVPTVHDADLAAELAAWAATCADADVQAWMRRAWESAATDDVAFVLREVALRALAGGPDRQRLVDAFRAAVLAGPLSDSEEALPYELIATMPDRLGAADLELLAQLALLPPLGDPERERALARRWPDGRHGFQLSAAVGQRLLGADPAGAAAAFAHQAAAALAHEHGRAISPQRLLVLWRSLARDRDVLRAVGGATAELCLALDDPAALARGPAHWLRYEGLRALGHHVHAEQVDVAREHARQAQAWLLWRAADTTTARLFLGEREPAAGRDPWAALAAEPHVSALLVARAAGDRAAAARAAAAVLELAGHDAATRAIASPNEEDPNR